MAAQGKRVCPSGSQTSEKKRRQISVSIFEKWQCEFNRDYQSLLWLRYDKDVVNWSLVATLCCEVCRRFEDLVQGMRNFSPAWLTGSTKHKPSNVLDHAKSEQQTTSMVRFQEERAKSQDVPASSYAPIIRSLMVLEDHEKARMKHKFEICYVIARESLAFLKVSSVACSSLAAECWARLLLY